MNIEEWSDYLAGYFKALVHIWKLSEWPWDTTAYWVAAIGSVSAAYIALHSVKQAQAAAEDSREAAREAREDEAKRAEGTFRRAQKDEALRLASDTKALLLRVQAETAAIEAELNSIANLISQIGTIQGIWGRNGLNLLFREIREKRTDLEARLTSIEGYVLPYDPAISGGSLDEALQGLRQIKAETDALETYARAAIQDHRSRLMRRTRPESGAGTAEAPSDPPSPKAE